MSAQVLRSNMPTIPNDSTRQDTVLIRVCINLAQVSHTSVRKAGVVTDNCLVVVVSLMFHAGFFVPSFCMACFVLL